MKVFKILCIALFGLMIGCKSVNKITSTGQLDSNITSGQIIKEHFKQEAKFKTLQSRVKVEYRQ